MLRKLGMTPGTSDRLSMELLRRRREPVNLIEQGLRGNRASQKVLHQLSRVALGPVAQQMLLQPSVPSRIARVERPQSFANVPTHFRSQHRAQSVVHHVTGGVYQLFAQHPPGKLGMRNDMEIVVRDLGP